MPENSASFTGDIPSHYDSGLGPVIFYNYADDLAARCRAHAPQDVLELAAGTGIVSQRLRRKLPPGCKLTVTDLHEPMLELAKAKLSDAKNVAFQPADAMALPFEDGSFDLIACQFGVMFFPDKAAAFHQAARVLKSGGHYVFNVWAPMTRNPFSQIADTIAAQFFPEDPPGFYKVPFHYGDPEAVKADLSGEDWSQVSHETVTQNKTIEDPEKFAEALVYGNPLVDEIRSRGGVDPDEIASAILDELRNRFGPPPLQMPLEAVFFTCRRQ
ncbi:class I SAM-dependent methyltransferase [Leisingera sp. ANG59]|uniref:class I SAM-dependent methyltransferase n=1 Tax=Leisingera sp. ANG59 TaxID=2675221 RepID=UPI001572D95E|nr:class I SAM-dependent methyltransferase [Leisingera sp. ANG59]NSY36673.1 methyltransferase domain-containing protein [Leisingera sp. ANG59]